MKKILALVIASVMVVGAAAPSFAAAPDKCVFKDASLCNTQSINTLNNDDN